MKTFPFCVEKKRYIDTSSDNNNLVIISDSEEKGEENIRLKIIYYQ